MSKDCQEQTFQFSYLLASHVVVDLKYREMRPITPLLMMRSQAAINSAPQSQTSPGDSDVDDLILRLSSSQYSSGFSVDTVHIDHACVVGRDPTRRVSRIFATA